MGIPRGTGLLDGPGERLPIPEQSVCGDGPDIRRPRDGAGALQISLFNIRSRSSSELLKIRFVCVSQSTGTVTRPANVGSVAAYALLRNWKPFTGSVE